MAGAPPTEDLRRELLAIAEAGRGRPEAALARCEALLASQPGLVAVHCLAGHLERRLGRLERAQAHIEAALARDPRAAPALAEAAQLAFAASDWAAARRYLGRLVRERPAADEAWFNLALAAERLGRYQEAIGAYERALSLAPPRPREIELRLAGVLAAAGRREEAGRRYRAVLEDGPDEADALVGLAQIALAAGELETALAHLRTAVARQPEHAGAWQLLLESRRIEDEGDEELGHARRLLESAVLDDEGEERLRYGLGKACDDLGHRDEAFSHFRRANALKRARLPAFDRAACTRDFEDLAAAATAARPPTGGEARPVPVFIVGLPRSGTTLLDQILTAHPDVAGVGEQPWFERALGGAPAAAWAGLDEARRREIARDCRRLLRDAGDRVVTNKFPAHFRHLGLIAATLPEARILHVTRDVRDTALSIYAQDFPVGNLYANDLEDIAAYVNGYRRLMAAWRESLGPAIFDLGYEALLADPAATIRSVLDFVGLPWDDRCLDFTRNARPVETLSRWQVRQPLYRSSVGRWRHYRTQLAPLLAALDPPAAPD